MKISINDVSSSAKYSWEIEDLCQDGKKDLMHDWKENVFQTVTKDLLSRVLIASSFREKKGISYALEALGRIQKDVRLEGKDSSNRNNGI